jgi:23S rRNA (adenine2030-N6)-methyltransferase
MNYRHAFHAGNFADLVKHAALTLLLDRLTASDGPLVVIDTHAGAGAYDLGGVMALRSGEAAIDKLLADDAAPEEFDALVAAVRRINPDGGAAVYPGSPALVCAALRAEDRFFACELRPDDYRELAGLLEPMADQAIALQTDGFVAVVEHTPVGGKTLVLIDPPFEQRDDYRRCVVAARDVLMRNPVALVLIWTPLKDLETFDAFLRDLEAAGLPSALVAETRLRSLADPMRLNGCALTLIGAPADFHDELQAICGWAAQALGDFGNEARIWHL